MFKYFKDLFLAKILLKASILFLNLLKLTALSVKDSILLLCPSKLKIHSHNIRQIHHCSIPTFLQKDVLLASLLNLGKLRY